MKRVVNDLPGMTPAVNCLYSGADTDCVVTFQKNRSFSLNSPENESSSDPTSPSPLSKLQTGHAHSMLLKLMSESDSKSVAFTDEVISYHLFWS